MRQHCVVVFSCGAFCTEQKLKSPGFGGLRSSSLVPKLLEVLGCFQALVAFIWLVKQIYSFCIGLLVILDPCFVQGIGHVGKCCCVYHGRQVSFCRGIWCMKRAVVVILTLYFKLGQKTCVVYIWCESWILIVLSDNMAELCAYMSTDETGGVFWSTSS